MRSIGSSCLLGDIPVDWCETSALEMLVSFAKHLATKEEFGRQWRWMRSTNHKVLAGVDRLVVYRMHHHHHPPVSTSRR
jgi:hypothetical protein